MFEQLVTQVKKNDLLDKVAVVEIGNRTISYSELNFEVNKITSKLKVQGVKKGDHVVLLGKNTISYVVAFFAIQEIKAIVIPLPHSIGKWELEQAIIAADADWIFFSNKELNTFQFKLPIQSVDNYELLMIPGKRLKKYLPENISVFLRTSGSTDAPKIVMHSKDTLLSCAFNHASAVGMNADEKSLVVLPLCFSFAFTSQMLAVLFSGGTLYLYNKTIFSPISFLEIVRKEKITSSALVSIHIKLLSQFTPKPADLNSLSYICYAGGPTTYNEIKKTQELFPNVKFLQGYGLTEAGPRVSVVRPDCTYKLAMEHHSGPPVNGVQVEIRNSENEKLAQGMIGEIFVKSPSLMLGYCKREDLTKQVLIDGWLKTGDIGYLNDENCIVVVGRVKNIIISMGNNVSPEEIENFLQLHPDVNDAFAYGEPDTFSGEIIVADVVSKNSLNLTEENLIKYCRSGLSSYKVPKKINLVKHITRTESGKISRRKEVNI